MIVVMFWWTCLVSLLVAVWTHFYESTPDYDPFGFPDTWDQVVSMDRRGAPGKVHLHQWNMDPRLVYALQWEPIYVATTGLAPLPGPGAVRACRRWAARRRLQPRVHLTASLVCSCGQEVQSRHLAAVLAGPDGEFFQDEVIDTSIVYTIPDLDVLWQIMGGHLCHSLVQVTVPLVAGAHSLHEYVWWQD